MIRYKGQKIVKVYAKPAPTVAGGTMIASGGYLGTYKQPSQLFYFDEEKTVAGGEKRMVSFRVTNVKKTGNYKKGQLVGL